MGSGLAQAGMAGASFVAGQQQQKKVKSAEKNRKKELLGLQGGLLDIANESYADQLGYLKSANKASQGGWDAMIQDANRQEAQSRSDVNRMFTAALGSANGAAASRGLLGSTVNTNMRLGAARQASYALSDAQLAASRLRSSAMIGKGQAAAQGNQSLAGLSAYRAGTKAQALLPYMNFLGNVQYTSQQPQLGNLAALTSQFGQWKPTGTV